MRSKPESKAARLRKADQLLRLLLRTPKTRSGLIAAVTASSKGAVTRNFVYGWLSEQTRTGTVTTFKGGGPVTYQITEAIVVEVIPPSHFPSWVDPRQVPAARSRQVFISGQRTTTNKDST